MNSMFKRLLSIIVSLALALSLIPWGAANVNAATNEVSAETLYSDSFDEDMALTDAGWNNSANANIQNGTLNVSHTAASGNTAIYHGFENISKVTVEFNFTLNYEGEDDLSHAIIRLRSSGTNLLALIVRRHQMKVNTAWVNYGEVWASGTIHKMKLVADTETDTCDVYVDGNLLKDDVAFTASADSINQLVVGAQGNGSGTTGITVCYDNISVKCSHIPGEWIVDTAANCVTEGSRYQICTICKTESNRETIPTTEHAVEDDGDCTTDAYCLVCEGLVIAAHAKHKYTNEYDTTCDNANCTATREVEKTPLLWDDFNTDMALTEAGWNNNANANIQNGTLNITHTAASGNVAIYHGFEDAPNVSVEFDFTLNYEGEDDTSHAMVRLRNSGTNQLVLIVKRHQMKVNSTWVNYSETLVSGTTHKMKIVAYAESTVCDVYIDGKLLADNVALTGDFDSINQLVLGAQGNGSGTTGITVAYDNLLAYSGSVECNHIPGEWIVETPAGCVTEGERYQICTICQELTRETIPAEGHTVQEDGDCTTAANCSVCGTLVIAAQEEHKYTDEIDTTCDNAGCTATREVEKTLLLRDDFNTDMTLTEAGWNNNANANIQNGTLNVTHTAASGNVAIFHGFEDASNVTVEFDFTLNYEGDDDESHAMVRLRNSGTNLLVLVVRRHQMKIGDTWVNYGETWASGTTHTIKLVVDTDTDTCVMYVDGKMFKDDISLQVDSNAVNQLVLGAQKGETATGITVSYDNLLAYSGGTECNHAWVDAALSCIPQTCSVCNISKFFASEHTYDEGTVTQEPTYTVAGIMTYTCECGESYTEEIPVLASPVKQWNIALKEDIGLNFYLNLTDEQIQNSTLTVTFNGTSNDVDLTKLPTSEEGYRVVSVDVAAAQMNDKVTLELTIDGEQVTKEYSVRQYAEYVMDEANGFDAATKQVVLDMLHYGAAAQTYFGYNTDPLANDGYEDNTDGNIAANTGYTNVVIEGSVDGIRFYGASLLFQKNISVRYYFTVNEGVDLTSYTFTIGETAYEVQNNGMYYIQIDNIYPYDIDESITVVVSDGTSSMSVQYCPMNYVVRQYGKTENGNLKALLQQLYDYYVAVSEYMDVRTNEAVELRYTTGLTDSQNYDNDIYGMNLMQDITGSDPGVFYISQEEDAQYGGYYYMYLSDRKVIVDEQTGLEVEQVVVRRSKDMYNWEACGVYAGGRCLQIFEEDWIDNVNTAAFWAPEVIRNPADGKYYMYFTAIAKIGQVPGTSTAGTNDNTVDTENYKDRMFLGVAVSDTPVGPFSVVYDTDATTGNRIPTINFTQAYNSYECFRILDGNPFFDDDGTFYLYFVRHDGTWYQNNRVCGVKMEDMAHPDYDTFSYLAQPSYKTVNFKPGDDPTNIYKLTIGCEKYYTSSATPEFYAKNEGPDMVKYNGKYYLTYSEGQYRDANYSVHVAVSDKPLQSFTKLDPDEGGQVCFGGLAGNMNGTGHAAVVENTDTGEWWIAYHRHGDTNEWVDGVSVRKISVDRICWITNPNVDFKVPTTNGPLYGLNWLPESASGYANLAQTAAITVNAGSGSEYLTDELLPFYEHIQDRVYEVNKSQLADGRIEIKLSWDKPVDVSSVMVYNAYGKEAAFGEITQVKFTLAEQPVNSSIRDYKYAVINNVVLPDIYWDAETQVFSNCAPIVARFDPVSVTEITIIIDSSLLEGNTEFNVNEIVVLGKE